MGASLRCCRLVAALCFTSFLWPTTAPAQIEWTPVIEAAKKAGEKDNPDPNLRWEAVTKNPTSSADLVWEPLAPNQATKAPEDLLWSEPIDSFLDEAEVVEDEKQKSVDANQPNFAVGLRWPNGQIMSDEDQIYFRTAYSRGSMIQIGETVYPNLGFNALQRKPGSFVNLQISAIDDSWQAAPSPCEDGDFFDQCSDGLMQNNIALWANKDFSFDLQWTIHSLSGEGAPFNFTVGEETFGDGDAGTKFGEGQSFGFKLSKNFGKTFGLSIGGDRLIHRDKTTDLPRNLSITGTKIFRLNDSIEPPIISLSLGLISDVYNPATNLGTIKYPKWMRGGLYPSTFAVEYDNFLDDRYAENTAGVSSAFVCAEQSIFKQKPLRAADKECIEDVFIGPIASIGYAPWPWLGAYAMYNNDINFGISFKPFKDINWQFGFELVAPIKGVNPGTDRHIDFAICPEDNYSFSACRTRVGFFTDLSF